MRYNKGEQLTVGRLREYLSCIPGDVKIKVGMGDRSAPLHYLEKRGGELILLPDAYMQDAEETNMRTIISFQKML